jgi:hypothetical protein
MYQCLPRLNLFSIEADRQPPFRLLQPVLCVIQDSRSVSAAMHVPVGGPAAFPNNSIYDDQRLRMTLCYYGLD